MKFVVFSVLSLAGLSYAAEPNYKTKLAAFEKQIEVIDGIQSDFPKLIAHYEGRLAVDPSNLKKAKASLTKSTELLQRHAGMDPIDREKAHRALAERTEKTITLLGQLVERYEKSLPDNASALASLRSHLEDFEKLGDQFKHRVRQDNIPAAQDLVAELQKRAVELNQEYDRLTQGFIDYDDLERKMSLIRADLQKMYLEHGIDLGS